MGVADGAAVDTADRDASIAGDEGDEDAEAPGEGEPDVLAWMGGDGPSGDGDEERGEVAPASMDEDGECGRGVGSGDAALEGERDADEVGEVGDVGSVDVEGDADEAGEVGDV